MNEHDEATQQRAGRLPLLLGAGLTVFFAGFLVLITFGFLIDLALVLGGIVLLGVFHWFAWGKALTRLTAGEREEAELLDRARAVEPMTTYRDRDGKYREGREGYRR